MSVLTQRLRQRVLPGGLGGHVADDRHVGPVGQGREGLLAARFVHVDQGELAALVGELGGDAPAEAGAGAGHDADFVREATEAHCEKIRCWWNFSEL